MLQIYLLGNFRIEKDGVLIDDWAWPRRKARTLLKLLAHRPGYQLHREQACELLWPNTSAELAQNNLYRIMHYLRRTLEPELSKFSQSNYISFRREIIRLEESAGLWVDLTVFQQQLLLASLQNNPLSALEEAVRLYRGDLLEEDLYEEWVLNPREMVWRSFAEVLRKLANLHRQNGNYTQAAAMLERLVARETLDESVHHDLMLTYALAGRRHDAIRQYLQCRKFLATELSLEPMTATVELYQRILSGHFEPAPALLVHSH